MYHLILVMTVLSTMALVTSLRPIISSMPDIRARPALGGSSKQEPSRARSWTTGGPGFCFDTQAFDRPTFASRFSFEAERAGFEPAEGSYVPSPV
jgi:hypothetical protein